MHCSISLDGISPNTPAHSLYVMLFTFFYDELIGNFILLHKDTPRVFTDAYLADLSTLFDLFCDEYTFAENVVSDEFGANDASHDVACVNTDSDIELIKPCIRRLPNLFRRIQHLNSRDNYTVRFLKNN